MPHQYWMSIFFTFPWIGALIFFKKHDKRLKQLLILLDGMIVALNLDESVKSQKSAQVFWLCDKAPAFRRFMALPLNKREELYFLPVHSLRR